MLTAFTRKFSTKTMAVSCYAAKAGNGNVFRPLPDENVQIIKEAIDYAVDEPQDHLYLQFHLLDSALRKDHNDDLVRFLNDHSAVELLDWSSDTLYLKTRSRQLLTIRLFGAPMGGFNMHDYKQKTTTTPADSESESNNEQDATTDDVDVEVDLAKQVKKKVSVSERKPKAKVNKKKKKARFSDEGLPVNNYPSSSDSSFDLDNDELDGLVDKQAAKKSVKVAKKTVKPVNRKIFDDESDGSFEMTQKEVHGLDSFAQFY